MASVEIGYRPSGFPLFSARRIRTLHVGALAVALLARPTRGEDVQPSVGFSEMRLEVTWVRSNAEIEHARKRYGQEIEQEGHRLVPQKPEGFAVLVARNGELICRLWVLQPKNVDDERTTALGHELLHCLAGNYHR